MITLEPPLDLADGAGQMAEAAAWREAGLSRSGLSRFLRSAQAAVGLSGEVDVLLANDRTLRRLNRQFRGKNKATDVLSFPASQEFAGEAWPELAGEASQEFAGEASPEFAGESSGQVACVHAGDLAISLDTAQRQAAEHGHSLRDEVRVLLVHGLLHLAGMDHETDGGEMAAREAELRVQLKLPNGLIARVETKATSKRKGPGADKRASGAMRGRKPKAGAR